MYTQENQKWHLNLILGAKSQKRSSLPDMMEAIRDISMFLTRFNFSSSYGDTSYSSYAKKAEQRPHQLRIQHIQTLNAGIKPTCESHSPVDLEAVFLPARATLTLANLEGAIALQGVLGLQALQPRVCPEGRHGFLGRAVLQQSIDGHAGLLLDASLLGHQTVYGCRYCHATCKKS